MVLSNTLQSVMDGEENEQMGGQYLVCFGGEKKYGTEEDEDLWPHCLKKTAWRKDCRGRGKASGEGADLQRPGSKILKEWTTVDMADAGD